ncbi:MULTISPECIES: phycobiliprotein lyase [Okeania]|uniref:Chromophore lyase CpcS/CpeS n=1 Tax=Okeania hirsuta TaxID=1458930 RepID=A0A3N6RFJ6_9CYAN|nr:MULTISPECIES: phycobiliprotein lyase [Okeania]NEP07863.1 phycobiliprotein lyase [Okeania sp. SIO4D6]NEP44628.1 phycobiliprotein lyase [Okeania sp. SIO2H7]NET14920.1 phycobiliprotein lyase [Okeania sp. SIO1H6]NEP70734.1 phycobiliprotein lyase [Okeania sp. SIO2G5]NEP93433.1 phycobiliprotein lyase [Okeania sp. SIO2F5]
MDIIEFLQLSAGQWFSQRTIHNLVSGELQAGKSEVNVEILEKTNPTVIRLCEQHQTDPSVAQLVGLQINWNGTINREQVKDIGATMLIVIPNSDDPHQGRLLQDKGDGKSTNISGRYIMGSDDVLTFITESEDLYAEERFWYLMPNLRLRTSVVKRPLGFTLASFCSEIRRVKN